VVDVRVYADEVILNLERLPQKIREAMEIKMARVIDDLRNQTFSKKPGSFIDPSTVETGVDVQGRYTVIGYIQTKDKQGYYSILPTKARVLRFWTTGGEKVFARQVYRHPYLKGERLVAETLMRLKPWIVEELEDAVVEAL
jgi:hypothetical protein